jgi:hypothetical protein
MLYLCKFAQEALHHNGVGLRVAPRSGLALHYGVLRHAFTPDSAAEKLPLPQLITLEKYSRRSVSGEQIGLSLLSEG